ncbi:MAG: efflux RND transporter permease subunit [Bacteroidales bacterium]|nr:efflux RND transporter permease subunit [Bacteroidales bacterium]
MLSKIIHFSLSNKLIILVGAVLLIVAGVYSAEKMDIDVFPDLTAPTVVVMTDAEGMAVEEIERLVTFPIETAVNGATDVRRVRSTSLAGSSFVWIEFDWGTDVFKARQIVSEKMVTLSESLPEGISPVLAPQSSVMGEILFIGLQSDSTSMMDLRTLADWVIKPAILATGGVSQVTVIGGDYKQYQILADPVKMQTYGITMKQLEETGASFCANSTGGVVREYGNEYALRGMARTTDLDELGNTLITKINDTPVRVSDVADIVIGSAVKMGYASHNAKPAVILSVSKQPNINTLSVTKKIEENLKEIQKSLPPDIVMDTNIFKQSDFIEASVDNVGRALVEGAIFVTIILFLFLGNFRTTVISVLSIPLSLLGTMVVLKLLGMNINTMTLGGMCIAIGSLVDDAIIDVENVYKRLRQNHMLPKEKRLSIFSVVFDGSVEIRASIINATFIIAVAFVPLFFLSGMEGRMLKPLGIAYIISLFMSLIVAMTVTPLLCKLILGREKYLDNQVKDSWVNVKLSGLYSKSLAWAMNHRKAILVPSFVALLICIVLLFTMGQNFLPDFNEGSLTISVVAQPGISLEENNKIGNLVEQELLKIPEVVSTARRTGRGELDEHSQMTNSAEIDVNLDLSHRKQAAVVEEVRHTLSEIPGIVTSVGQPLGHRIDHILTGTSADVVIKLFGSDLSKMYSIGNEIKEAIEDVEGITDISVEQQTETPQLQIRANRNMLAQYGITIEEFNDFVESAFSSKKIGEIFEEQRSFDLIIRLNDDHVGSIDKVKTALIDTDNGTKVPLEQVADIVSVGGPNTISRENVQRKLTITANSVGRDLKGIVKDIQNIIDEDVNLPEGYFLEYGGQFESARSATRTLILASLAAILVIFLLLYGEFKDINLSSIILLNLPLTLIGGVLAIFFSSRIISIPSIIGFITLFGIAIRNGILLISRYQRLENQHLGLRKAIVDGSIDRLAPILMTALTAALALIPLVMNGDKSGNEIQSPMGIVVLGGLLTSTFLNMYVVPIVYERFEERKRKSKEKLSE